MKQCNSCINPRNWGYSPYCKDCIRKRAYKNYQKYKDDPLFRKQKRRIYQNWYKRNGRIRPIDYQEAILEWIRNNPEKVKAHRLVQNAVKQGIIYKSETCEACKRKTRLSGHHNDYSKPLEVIWLCGSCHKLTHLTAISEHVV